MRAIACYSPFRSISETLLLKLIRNFVLLNKLAILSDSEISLHQQSWFFSILLKFLCEEKFCA